MLQRKLSDLQALRDQIDEEIRKTEAEIEHVAITEACQQMRKDQSKTLWLLPRNCPEQAKIIKDQLADEGYIDLGSYLVGEAVITQSRLEKDSADEALVREDWWVTYSDYDREGQSNEKADWDYELDHRWVSKDFVDFNLVFLTPRGIDTEELYNWTTQKYFNKDWELDWEWASPLLNYEEFNGPVTLSLIVWLRPYVFARRSHCQDWLNNREP